MENGQEETKIDDTNNVAEEAADEMNDKVKNATPIAGDSNDAKGGNNEKEGNNAKEGDDLKEADDVKKADDGEKADDVKENDVEEDESSAGLLEKIREQVEYYFGNVNMHKDKFLIEQTKLDNGWIPMNIMLNFRQLTNLSRDVDIILQALKASELMEISEDGKKIRRSPKHPLPEYNEEYRKAQEARTVYIKGFPQTGMDIEKLKAYFAPYKPFDTIVMRKYQDKEKNFKFKGSVFVQFKTIDIAKVFMDAESVKYNDTELIRKWAADYAVEKAQEKEERRRKKPDNKSKKAAGVEQNETKNEEADSTPASTEIKLPRGSVIYFSGVSKICVREEIKERLEELHAEVAYIDFQRGNTEGWIRLQGENAAKPLLDKMEEGKVQINKSEVTCRILEGEEEEKYLIKVTEEMIAAKNKHSKGKRGGKKGRNVRGGKKRGSSPARDAVPVKKGKVAE
ncbi:PREDICTED: la protein homolog [Dinoponera quadriceps]|uniref:La protein homolog n=1 Tax=Dinoponera quadriceps TaxID=609295 RepID=A0A6P3XDM7_DINQU|nr:PREDICTED: la protein homolog [Dinoponera quadriceps]